MMTFMLLRNFKRKGQLSARVFSFLASRHITAFASLHFVFEWEGRATSSNNWGEPH